MKRILSIILSFTLIFTVGSINISAKAYDLESVGEEACYLEEFGGTLIRYTESDAVIVKWIPKNSNTDSFTIINKDGVIKVNGNILISLNDTNVELDQSGVSLFATDISWGKWQTFNEQINTGGVPVAVAAGIIAAAAPWVTIRVIAAAITGFASSEYYTLSGKIRYGSDDTYYYYERYTSIQSDSGTYIIKDFFDSGKEPLR